MSQVPVNVSPLIKLGRWSLLTLGFFYGVTNRKRLSAKEKKVREVEAQQKVIRDAKLAEEKVRRAEDERKGMALLFGGPSAPAGSGGGGH